MILKPAQINFDFVQSDVEFVQTRPSQAIQAPFRQIFGNEKSRDASSGIAGSDIGSGVSPT